eukprot:SAG31_NODE_41350_length_276_cov_1.022599_1_plen_60_part_10
MKRVAQKYYSLLPVLLLCSSTTRDEDGSKAWLRYHQIDSSLIPACGPPDNGYMYSGHDVI